MISSVRIAGLNVCTLGEGGMYHDGESYTARLPEYLAACDRRNVEIVVFMETRVPGPSNMGAVGYHCMFSGLEANADHRADGIMIVIKE